MRFRGRSIRRKIVALLLVPLLALTCIWAFAAHVTSREVRQLISLDRIVSDVVEPARATVHAVQQERRQALVHLADPRRSDAAARLRSSQRATDEAAAATRKDAAGARDELPAESRKELDAALAALDGLEAIRSKVAANTLSRENAFTAYNDVIDPCFALYASLHVSEDVRLDKEARALTGLSRAQELVSREDALIAAALAADRVTGKEVRAFGDRVAERNATYENSLPLLPDADRRIFEEYWEGADGRTLTGLEDDVVTAGASDPMRSVNAERWESAATTVLDDLRRMNDEAATRYLERIEPEARAVLVRAGVAVALGLLAVLLSVAVSFRIGRSLIRDLGTLRREAHEVSAVRLPSVMRRLAAGEQVDVETEAPRLEYGPDEMGQVGQALNTLQRAAVEAAVKQADMRRGVSEVFVNLARRNQVLLHRQLALLDAMERRTEDADELADLFRLDHLTTRMRRHAEGLVILSGATPSRQWRKPVQLMDVVRAAVGEVEDYERIEVRRLPRLAVEGPAVADLTHLIAELLENATSFSPPHTAVQVLGERVTNGFTLEIHDRGLGMAPDAMLQANLRLAETPEFELSDTDRLGLFVVSRLALRQGARVALQPSPYGGTTAVVLIPGSVLTESETTGRHPTRHRTDRAPERRSAGVTHRVPAALDRPSRTAAVPEGHRLLGARGPIELEGPLDALDDLLPASDGPGGLLRELRERADGDDPAAVQHQHAEDESTRTAEDGSAVTPLPRRRPLGRSGPVLVSDRGRPVSGPSEPGGSGPDAADHEPDAAARNEASTAPGSTVGGTVGGLPRRVRRTAPAPRRGDGGPAGADGAAGGGRGTPAPEDRDADEVRSRMAALQRGWQRGRQQNDASVPEGEDR